MDQFENFLNQSLQNNKFEIYSLAGDASSRKYYRVVDGDQSYILMSWHPFDPEKSPFLNILCFFENHSVRVPKIISQSGSQGLILLEDLGDLTLERKFWSFQDQKFVLPYYHQAIDELIKIQIHSTQDPDKTNIAFNIKFDTEKFMWEFSYTLKNLIHKLLGFNDENLELEVQKNFIDISERLSSHSKFVSHRDYHSRNLMIKLGKVHVIDFQDARLGPLQYDLVSLLKDSYINLNSKNENELIKYYKEKVKSESSTDFISNDFDEIYKLQVIQRCFKACGSFSSFYNDRNDKRYLKYLKNTVQLVANELENLNSYKPLLSMLRESGAIEFNYEGL